MKAFPKTSSYDENNGMNLRDYFAAKAMQGMMSDDNEYEEEVLRRENYEEFCVLIAESAYTMADVMMRVREK